MIKISNNSVNNKKYKSYNIKMINNEIIIKNNKILKINKKYLKIIKKLNNF